MADKRKQYDVNVHGIKHTMLLEPEDAKSLYGDNAVESKEQPAPANKSRTAENK